MALRVYKEGNKIIYSDDTFDKDLEDNSAEVDVYPAPSAADFDYTLKGRYIGEREIVIDPSTGVQDESGTAYTDQGWIDFYRANTGFSSASGGSGANGITGWVQVGDDGSTPQVFTGTPTKVLISGSSVIDTYLPDGVTEMYDTTDNEIIPTGVGDTYDLRLIMQITATVSNPTRAKLYLDIGGDTTVTNAIVEDSKTLRTGAQPILFTFPYYSLATFLANNGQLFVEVDSGSITVSTKTLFIERKSKA